MKNLGYKYTYVNTHKNHVKCIEKTLNKKLSIGGRLNHEEVLFKISGLKILLW